MLHGQSTASAVNGMDRRKSSGHMDFGAGSWLFLRAKSQPQLNAEYDAQRGPYSPAKAQAHAQTAIDCIRKVMVNDQSAIVVIFPFAVLWVTGDSHIPLGVPADLESLTLALEQKVSSEDSSELAEKILRGARCAELGITTNSTLDSTGFLKSQRYKVDIDCYFKDPDLHCAIALLTPGALLPESTELRYEQAQLSSVRYHIGVMSNAMGDSDHHTSTNDTNTSGNASTGHSSNQYSPFTHDFDLTAASGSRPATHSRERAESMDAASYASTQHMHDFIPSMTCREVEYFYSLLPGSASGTYMHHEQEVAHSTSIIEQEQQVTDPDHLDPHQRLRLLQSVPTVLPRRPRDLAEVQAEAAVAAQRGVELRQPGGGAGFAGYNTLLPPPPPQGPVYKKSGIKCLECGVDQSPEWRKGPMGPKTLCNRCGLRYAKKLRLQSK